MKAALEEFRQDIQNESREAVIEIAVTLYRERESVQSELNELRSVHTGIVREYQKLKEAFERSEADRQELIRQNQHITSIRTMQSNELFGRSSEKTEDVLNKAVGGDDPGSDDPIDEDASDDPTGTPSSKDVAGMSEAEVRRLLEDILGEKERRKKEKGKRERDLSKASGT